MLDVAAYGHLDILQWLHETYSGQGQLCQVMSLAVKNNHLHVLKWLHENRTDVCIDWSAMETAASNGSLEIVQWLLANRPEYNEVDELLFDDKDSQDPIESAAAGGLECD